MDWLADLPPFAELAVLLLAGWAWVALVRRHDRRIHGEIAAELDRQRRAKKSGEVARRRRSRADEAGS